MIPVKIIRGYKLYLWAKRLGIKEEYRNTEIDIKALYYIHSVIPVDELTSKVIVLTNPKPIIFEAPNTTINLLLETFEIEDK